MSKEPQDNRKISLLRSLQGVEEKAAQIEGIGQSFIQTARFSRDVASCIGDAIRAMPNDSTLTSPLLDRVEAGCRAWEGTAVPILRNVPTFATSFGATAANLATTGSDLFDRTLALDLPNASRGIVEQAANRFELVFKSVNLFAEVKAAMVRLALHQRSANRRSPCELLEEAEAALSRPSAENTGPIGVLIAVRESIEATLSALVARRPNQERAKHTSNKIESIGGQCGRPGLPSDYFGRLSASTSSLLNRLSAAKQRDLSRPEVIYEYNQALAFLQAFLNSLDETRLQQ